MNERDVRPGEPPDPYWTEHTDLGLIFYGRGHRPLRARSHIEQERLSRGSEALFGIPRRETTTIYHQTRLIIPGAGFVQETRLADGQAWHYGADRTIVLWELLPEPRLTVADPRESFLYRSLWAKWEGLLTKRFPDADTLITTWEDVFERDNWEGFLKSMGYDKTGVAVFRKHIIRQE